MLSLTSPEVRIEARVNEWIEGAVRKRHEVSEEVESFKPLGQLQTRYQQMYKLLVRVNHRRRGKKNCEN